MKERVGGGAGISKGERYADASRLGFDTVTVSVETDVKVLFCVAVTVSTSRLVNIDIAVVVGKRVDVTFDVWLFASLTVVVVVRIVGN